MFKNPIAPKVKEKESKNPFSFKAPCYDQRNMISAGDNYGTGFRQPEGHSGFPKQKVSVLPFGRVKTMQDDGMSESRMGMYGEDKDQRY